MPYARRIPRLGLVSLGLILLTSIAGAQGVTVTSQGSADGANAKGYRSPKFWEDPGPIELTLVVNLKRLQADKADSAPWRAATVQINQEGAPASITARVRTRGQSRLKICDRFPPIWLDFKKEDVKGSVFQRLNRVKVVSPCKVQPEYERYVLQEYNLYRIHSLFTPVSHRARLLRMTVRDSASGKEAFTKWAFALEDADEVAERLGGEKLAVKGLAAEDYDPRQLALMGVLQYLIGNTDFSFSNLHNTEVISWKKTLFPIVYDYDQAGAINVPYSLPDPSLGIRRTTDRIYRGLCVPADTVLAVIAEVRARRPEIEALYKDEIGKLIGSGTDHTLKFFGDFFKDIDNPKTVQKEILSKCPTPR